MGTAAAVLTNFESDAWQADLYESLSLAARLSMAVKRVKAHGQNIKMSYWLWKINSRAAKFFAETDDILAGKVVPEPTANETLTPARIQESIDTLMRLGMSLNSVYEEARRRRLLKNSLIAGPVTALRSHADQFFEMAEWFDLILNADKVEQTFATANEQRIRGDVYDLSQV